MRDKRNGYSSFRPFLALSNGREHFSEPLVTQPVGDYFVSLNGIVMKVESVASLRQDGTIERNGSGEM